MSAVPERVTTTPPDSARTVISAPGAHELRRFHRRLAQRFAGVDHAPGHPADPRRRSAGGSGVGGDVGGREFHAARDLPGGDGRARLGGQAGGAARDGDQRQQQQAGHR